MIFIITIVELSIEVNGEHFPATLREEVNQIWPKNKHLQPTKTY